MTINFVLALGLTHTQSKLLGKEIVPLVSIAISNPTLRISNINSLFSCSSGSPPVQTTKGLDFEFLGQNFFSEFASCLGDSNFQPPSPSVPIKSVSQNLQIAFFLSFS